MQSPTRALSPHPANTSAGPQIDPRNGNSKEPASVTLNGEESLTPDHDLRRFAQNLFRLRNSLKLSRPTLAHQIGASAKALEHWEAATGNPPIRCIIALARYFGLTTDQLLGYELDAGEHSTRMDLLRRLVHDVAKHEARLAELEADIAFHRDMTDDIRAEESRAEKRGAAGGHSGSNLGAH